MPEFLKKKGDIPSGPGDLDGASGKEQSSLLPLYMCGSRIGPFLSLPPSPLIQLYLPHPLNWRMYIVTCSTPLLCWVFYPQ